MEVTPTHRSNPGRHGRSLSPLARPSRRSDIQERHDALVRPARRWSPSIQPSRRSGGGYRREEPLRSRRRYTVVSSSESMDPRRRSRGDTNSGGMTPPHTRKRLRTTDHHEPLQQMAASSGAKASVTHRAQQGSQKDQGPLNMSGITADTIQEAVECYVRQQGSPQAAAKALVLDTMASTEAGAQARATGLALAHVVEHHTHPPGQLKRFMELKGNMRKFYEDDIMKLGVFIATYPETVTELERWTEACDQKVKSFVEKCQSIAANPETRQDPHQLMMDLHEPDTIQDALHSMTEHMASGAWQVSADERKIKVLMATLITAEAPEATLQELDRHGLNLYRALVPHHLGKAMATGWVDWAEMAEWTAWSRRCKLEEAATQEVPPQGSVVHTVGMANVFPLVQGTLRSDWQSIIRNGKRDRDVSYEHFQDLRREHPPVDPKQRESRYEELRKNPRSPPDTLICRFQPKEPTDVRTRRWEWWTALSHIKVYVREYYLYTDWTNRINATAAGTPGQEVVRTGQGTVTWIPNDKRIVITDLGFQLQEQFRAGFAPWDPAVDMAKHYHRGKIPVNIVNAFQGRARPQLFQ